MWEVHGSGEETKVHELVIKETLSLQSYKHAFEHIFTHLKYKTLTTWSGAFHAIPAIENQVRTDEILINNVQHI